MAKRKRSRARKNPYAYSKKLGTGYTKSGAYPALRGVAEAPDYYHYICTLINPKDHKPVMAFFNSLADGVRIGTPVDDPNEFRSAGRGYFGIGDEPTQSSGCVRSHTPGGVSMTGAGLGVCLYSAMAMTIAYANATDGERYGMSDLYNALEDDCIGSMEGDRSYSADKFWERASRSGLAHHSPGGESCTEETREMEVGASCEPYVNIDAEDIEDYFDDEFSSVEEGGYEDTAGEIEGSVNVEVTFTGCKEIDSNIINASSVVENGLVLHVNPYLVDHLGIEVPPTEILLGIDFRGVRSVSLIAWALDEIMADKSVSWKQVTEWRRRNLPAWAGVDPDKYERAEGGPYPRLKKNPSSKQGPVRNARAWKAYFGKLATVNWD